ncbi:MAG TPA: TatD family hydrolase [Bacillota bacterium]|nr:TatD family hydrolase [Bacillota bacterium]
MLFDTHAHLDGKEYDGDRDEVIKRAGEAGVRLIVNVGFNLESSQKSIKLAEKHDIIYAAVGIHPHDAIEAGHDYLGKLERMAAHPKVVAVGETGLDYYRDLSPRQVQRRVFREQLLLARKLKKPVIVHDREAHGDIMKILRECPPGPSGGVMHCYSGSWEMAKEFMKMGFYISIAGPVTYPKAPKLKDVASKVPLDRLLLETDAPYLTPAPHRGRRNEPAYVFFTAEEVARLKDMDPEVLARTCAENGRRLFGIA